MQCTRTEYCTDSAFKAPTRTDGGHHYCGIFTSIHGARLPCKGKTTSLWPRRGCLHVSKTLELLRSEEPKGLVAAIMKLKFMRRDLSSHRHRALDAKHDPGHRYTLGRGRRRQADFRRSRSTLQEKILPIWRCETPKGDCEKRRGGGPSGLPIT